MNQERLLKVLLSPHVTNKAYEVAERSSYVVFKVATDATKKEIKNKPVAAITNFLASEEVKNSLLLIVKIFKTDFRVVNILSGIEFYGKSFAFFNKIKDSSYTAHYFILHESTLRYFTIVFVH